MDQVQLEVVRIILALTRRGQIPVVDVIGAEIVDVRKALVKRF